MIDYYLNKKCSLMFKGQREDTRCGGCVWLNKEIKKCLFSVDYPKTITLEEMKERIEKVNIKQQNKLSRPFRRFILKKKRRKTDGKT